MLRGLDSFFDLNVKEGYLTARVVKGFWDVDVAVCDAKTKVEDWQVLIDTKTF
jgi:hypothetical protein